jgi:hypothetical protein
MRPFPSGIFSRSGHPRLAEETKVPVRQVSLTRQPESWAGMPAADGTTVEVTGIVGAGPQAVIVAMARRWIAESGLAET